MKSLLKISATDCLQSLLPILMWFVVGIVYEDTDYFNVFTLTYSFQFIWGLIYRPIVVGAIKYKQLHSKLDDSYVYCSVLISALLFALISSLAILNVDKLSPDSKYNMFYAFSIFCLTIDIVVCGLSKVEQYNGNNKEAFHISVQFYTTRLILVAAVKLLIRDKLVAIIVTFASLLLYTIALCIRKMKLTNFYLNVFKGVKYQLSDIVSGLSMFIIYFFGLQKVISGSEVVLTAYTTLGLCTDTQWDTLWSAIETNTSIKVCNDTYNKNCKKLFKDSALFTFFLLFTSLVMLAVTYMLKPYDVKVLTIILFLECSMFPLYGVRYVCESYLMIEYHGIMLVVIPLSSYIIRILLTFTVKSCYALSISVFVCAIYSGFTMIMLYIVRRRKQL